MSEEIMNTKEVAQYLGIHEKQVYVLIKERKVPATRITGKWVFPKKMIDEWIASSAQKGLGEARQKGKRIEGALLAAGSNDPVLDILQTHIRNRYPEFFIFSANTGSTEGLRPSTRGIRTLPGRTSLILRPGNIIFLFYPRCCPISIRWW